MDPTNSAQADHGHRLQLMAFLFAGRPSDAILISKHKPYRREALMRFNSISRIMLAFVLSISVIATGCSAQWISVALADLPVLTQMALNITALIATLQSGEQLSPTEALGIQNISIEASKDLILLQGLYNAYKSNPSPATIQKIKTVIADINQNLPALLQAVH